MDDPNQKKKKDGSGSDSWSIPKKKSIPPPPPQRSQQHPHPNQQQQQNQRRPSSMEGSIPRRKSSTSSGNNPSHSHQSMIKHPPPTGSSASGNGRMNSSTAIPKKKKHNNSGSSSSSSSLSLTGAIPRRNLDHGKTSSSSSASSTSIHGAIPRKTSSHSNNNNNNNNKSSRDNHNHNQKSQNRSSTSSSSKGQRLSFKIPPASSSSSSSSPQRKQSSQAHHQASHVQRSSGDHHVSSSATTSTSTSKDTNTNHSKDLIVGPNVLSEHPFRILIDLKGVNHLATNNNAGGIHYVNQNQNRMSTTKANRSPVKKRERERKQPDYQELQDTDSDDFLTDSSDDDDDDDDDGDDDAYGSRNDNNKKKKSISKKVPKLKKPRTLDGTSSTTTTGGKTGNNSSKTTAAATATASGISAYQQIQYLGPSVVNVGALPATTFLELGNNSFDSPPVGTVASLWYSRDVFDNTYVVEKILAWRTRPTTQLEWETPPTASSNTTEETTKLPPITSSSTTPPPPPPVIDFTTAVKYSEMAKSCPLIWSDPKKRMEISRLDLQQCPVVLAMAVEAQAPLIKEEIQEPPKIMTEGKISSQPPSENNNNIASTINTTTTTKMITEVTKNNTEQQQGEQLHKEQDQTHNNVGDNRHLEVVTSSEQQGNLTTPQARGYRIKQHTKVSGGGVIDREEIYLIKWRGKSYKHASWERGADIIRMDQSNNTARSKIRKYVQSQELVFGMNWKKFLEEERATATNIHAHVGGDHKPETTVVDSSDEVVDEEYYPPAVTEVDRIMACDESEMDPSLFPKQRALNVLDEQEQIKQREKGETKRWNSKEGLKEMLTELPWDPEDNVRYIVKWKDLPFSEITWEYWKDIKKDAVDEAEDFWLRQKPPDDVTLSKHTRPHPHMQDFRKIQESPEYGISKRPRPVAESVNGQSVPKEDEDEDDPDSTNPGFRLRSYQLEGVNWLLFNWWNQRSCILADEMGLGKTIQSVGFIKLLQDLPTTGLRGPFLIVAPLSLIGQWQSESKTWAPDLNVVLYHGSADARDFVIKNDFFFSDQFVSKTTATKLRKQHVTKFHILITTYEVVMKDIDVFTKIKWKALIVDEAHRLKNSNSKLFEELLTVPRDYCLLLTGTPLANATEELWALLHFANKSVFNSKDDFLEKFGQLENSVQVQELHSILKPYLLRRVKEDVEKSMPPKTETILEVSLTPGQKKYYKAIYERNTSFLFKGSKPSNSPSLMNVMMELRKCCNHPFLIRGVEDKILAEAALQVNPSELDYVKIFEEQLVKSSGKMVLIDKVSRVVVSYKYRLLHQNHCRMNAYNYI
jgi:SNF2 family DNA or RNA helicase